MRYPAFRLVSLAARIIGYLGIVIGGYMTVLAIYALKEPMPPDQRIYVVATIAGGVVLAYLSLSIAIAGEIGKVFMDIEENTRNTATHAKDAAKTAPLSGLVAAAGNAA